MIPFFLCMLTSLVLAQIDTNTEESLFLTQQILETERVRLTDPLVFKDSLSALEAQVNQMSAYQYCHFNYLKLYQLAYEGQNEKAITDLELLASKCEDLRAQVRINALISNLSVMSGDFEKSSHNIDLVIQSAEKTSDIQTRVMAYSVASIVYDSLKQSDLSKKYSQLLYSIDPNPENNCKANYFTLLAEFNNSEYTVDQAKFDAAVNICNGASNKLITFLLTLNYIDYQVKHAFQYDEVQVKAIELLSAIEAGVAQTGYKNIQAYFYAIKAKVYWHNNQHEVAVEAANKALFINESIGNSQQYIIALNVLEMDAFSRGNYKDSYDYLYKKNQAKLQIFDETQAKQMAFMTVKHSNLAKVFELELLNQKNELLELEKKLSTQEANNQKLLIGLILTLLALMILWAYKIKRRHDYFKGVSEIDHLTKVLTRKAFEDQMEVLLNHCQANQAPIHVAIMDLDHFKHVNDNHGHLVGDWVLKNVIYACKPLVEESMIFARLGGEEFCLVMSDVDCEYMVSKLDKMRLAIENLDCSDSGAELTVTASFGMTSSETTGYSLPLLLTHADVALFKAKNQGRNQTVVYSNHLESS